MPAEPPGFGIAAPALDPIAARRVGASAVKLVADWSAIGRQRGQFVWNPLDRAIEAATAAKLQVVMVLAYTPLWASIATGPERADSRIFSRQPPRRLADWEAFTSAAARRYRGRVRDWQIWTTVSLPEFRGTAVDYRALVRAASAAVRTADSPGRIVLATPYGVDLISVRGALQEIGSTFQVVSLSPQPAPPETLLRPLGVLRDRLLGASSSKHLWLEWRQSEGSDARRVWPGNLLKLLAIGRAFGVERLFAAGEVDGETQKVLQTFAAYVGARQFTGYLVTREALALVFGDTTPVAVAWAPRGGAIVLDGSIEAFSPMGERRPLPTGAGRNVALGDDPLILTRLSPNVAADAARTLQTRGLPVPPAMADYGDAADVLAVLGRQNQERGLYNMPFRERRNGAVDVVEVGGVEAVRTNAAREAVFVYFDVDDTFLYYVDGRVDVEISVEVWGAGASRQLGFNLLYDSMSGYRFAPWQSVDPRQGWVTYTFQLHDANFSNTWGWDFSINAAGNRQEDLTVRSVRVRKLPRPGR